MSVGSISELWIFGAPNSYLTDESAIWWAWAIRLSLLSRSASSCGDHEPESHPLYTTHPSRKVLEVAPRTVLHRTIRTDDRPRFSRKKVLINHRTRMASVTGLHFDPRCPGRIASHNLLPDASRVLLPDGDFHASEVMQPWMLKARGRAAPLLTSQPGEKDVLLGMLTPIEIVGCAR